MPSYTQWIKDFKEIITLIAIKIRKFVTSKKLMFFFDK